MKKILFFDVDGTLVDFGASTMSKNTSDALIAAKKTDIKYFYVPVEVITRFILRLRLSILMGL